MSAADDYRALAALFRAKAHVADDPGQAAEWVHLAQSYLRLAEQAERNAALDLSVEIGPPVRLGSEESDESDESGGDGNDEPEHT